MKSLPAILAALLASAVASPALTAPQIPQIYGADGTFLGLLTPARISTDSFCHQYGNYGSQYSTVSIFNQYGVYGGKYSDTGAYNPTATNPPLVVRGGQVIGIISKNPNIGGAERSDPDALRIYVCRM